MTPDSPDARDRHGPSPLQGRKIAGRYRLDSIVGTGGVGTVWSATDEVLGRVVAVKDIVAPHWFAKDEQDSLRERTLREARATARIGQHPNVVTIYDVVEQDARLWIVMQFVQARSLAQVIEEDGPRGPGEVARIGIQVLDGLRAAHSHGILHRDVKPSNVLIDDEGRAILTDFGIATVDGDTTLTGTGVLMGAPAYIAPERTQGAPADTASDLWALGATLYTAVEGRPPFQRDGAYATLAAAINEDPDPAERAGELETLLVRLLARDPADRPDHEEVTRELWRVAVAASGDEPSPLGSFDATTWPNAISMPLQRQMSGPVYGPDVRPAAWDALPAHEPTVATVTAEAEPDRARAVDEPTTATPMGPAAGTGHDGVVRATAGPRRRRTALPAAASALGLVGAAVLGFVLMQGPGGDGIESPRQEVVDTSPGQQGEQPGPQPEPAAVQQPVSGADAPAAQVPAGGVTTTAPPAAPVPPPSGQTDVPAPTTSAPSDETTTVEPTTTTDPVEPTTTEPPPTTTSEETALP